MSSLPPSAAPAPTKRSRVGHTYDVFISHAGLDKHTMAKPLHEKLERLGITAFVDEKEMLPGREAPSAMMEAMETAAIGVFILSADFVARKWPVKELYCFLERVEKAALRRREKPVLIPVFYRLTTEQCHRIESLLGVYEGGRNAFIEGRFIQRQRTGEPEADLDKLQAAFTSLASHMGIRNLDNVTNDDSDEMEEKRGKLVDEVVNGVKKALKEKDEVNGNSAHASHLAKDEAVESTDAFQARFDLPVPLPNIVLNWDCDSDGVSTTMEGQLKKEIMDSTQDGDTSFVAAVDGGPIGVCGHGGVGKTSALIGVGREEDVQRHFKDGVYFVTVEGDATDGSMVGALARLVRQCGGVRTCSQISDCKSVEGAVQVAAGYFRGKRALFMFDDVWRTEKSAVGYLKEIRQLVATCPQSRVLISTRINYIARAGRRQVVFEPRDAEGGVAREMLCCSAEIEAEEMLEYEEELRTVLRFCRGLPLILQVAGCAIRELRYDGLPLRDAVESYVEDLRDGISRPATEGSEEYASFEDTVRVSLRMADKWYQREGGHRGSSGRSVSELYERLAVLGRQMHASRSMLKVLWALETDRDADVVLKKLSDLSLVKRRKKGEEVGANVHDLLVEFCEHAAGENVKDYHADVVSGYYKLRREDASQSGGSRSGIGSGGSPDVDADIRCWWEDGWRRRYIGENVCRHLAGAGKCEELAMLLTDARWALAQVRRRRLLGWIRDFNELFGAIQKRKTGGAGGLDLKNAQKGLEVVRDGVRESWGDWTRNEREFGWQMYARLVDRGGERMGSEANTGVGISTCREAVAASKVSVFSGARREVFYPSMRQGCEYCCANGQQGCSGCGKRRIFIVNLETREREKTLREHYGAERGAKSVGIERDEQRRDVACAHTNLVSCVAVSGNGRRIVSGSWDKTLRVWDARTGEPVGKPLLRHKGTVRCAAVSGGGRRVVHGSGDELLRVWDVDSEKSMSITLRGHTNGVWFVAMSRDGRCIVCRCEDGALRVWDVGGRKDCGQTAGRSRAWSDLCRLERGWATYCVRVWQWNGEGVGRMEREAHRRTVAGSGHEGRSSCVVVSGDGQRIVRVVG